MILNYYTLRFNGISLAPVTGKFTNNLALGLCKNQIFTLIDDESHPDHKYRVLHHKIFTLQDGGIGVTDLIGNYREDRPEALNPEVKASPGRN